MHYKGLLIGMTGLALLLVACEPVDEAVETGDTEIEESEIEENDSEVESSESESAEVEEIEEVAEAESDEESDSDETDINEEAEEETEEESESELVYDIESVDLPEPDDLPLETLYIEINDNIPFFTNEELEVSEPFDSYEPKDQLGRVGVAEALLDVDLMPSEERGSIGHIEPSGWNQGNYEVVSGNWLYNRSHLIGHQMTGYDGRENLMTGTRQFNAEGMLPFENFVANVVEEEEMQVRYRVTPLFEGDNLLSHGIVMEGFSVDDDGETLTFNVFVPNQQDGIELDYETGDHELVE
ncbi:MAG: DNA/RNA non-specific endonuclease [Alkalibacterium sp.]|nr:DNA/RNA non-specific endonuclease [Alkalibacterium sp.]